MMQGKPSVEPGPKEQAIRDFIAEFQAALREGAIPDA